MATQQHRLALFLGMVNVQGAGATTFALSGTPAVGGFAPTWLAYGWNPSESKTLSAVKVFASAVGGTLTSLACDIYSDTAGTGPNASLASSTTVTALPTGAAWVEFTGFSLALTAGTQYWIVLRNPTATPGTNFPTYRFGGVNSAWSPGGSESQNGLWGSACARSSTNSGTAWANAAKSGSWGWRVQYSDGTYDGMPLSNFSSLSAANMSFGKQAVGNQFVVPPNVVLNIRGASMAFVTSGTPGAASFKLYNGSTLLATSASIPRANMTAAFMFTAMFPSTVVVQPGTTLNLVVCDATTADASGTGYIQNVWTVDNDANSFALMPFEGTLAKVVTTDYTAGSPSFSTDQTSVVPFALILDSTGEFYPSGALLVA